MKKVIVADDDRAICDSMQMVLEDEGYCVKTVCDGKAIQNIPNEQPDLFLLDIAMSGIDGRDVVKKLKRNTATKDVPIVMVSASQDIARSAKESGADDYLPKPFHTDDLLYKVKKYT